MIEEIARLDESDTMVAATEAMLTTTPPSRPRRPAASYRKACLIPRAVPTTLTSSVRALPVGVEVDEQVGDFQAGVVDHDVQAAEPLGHRSHRGFPGGVVGDVEVDEAVFRPELGSDLGPAIVLQVGDRDGGSGRGQRAGCGLAEPAHPQ